MFPAASGAGRGGCIMTRALGILLNILLFAVATFGTSLMIEKYYRGGMKWILVPALTLLSGMLLVTTDFVVQVLTSLTAPFSLRDFALIVVGGGVIGFFFSFL